MQLAPERKLATQSIGRRYEDHINDLLASLLPEVSIERNVLDNVEFFDYDFMLKLPKSTKDCDLGIEVKTGHNLVYVLEGLRLIKYFQNLNNDHGYIRKDMSYLMDFYHMKTNVFVFVSSNKLMVYNRTSKRMYEGPAYFVRKFSDGTLKHSFFCNEADLDEVLRKAVGVASEIV